MDGFSNHTFKLTGPQKARRVFLEGERFDLHGYDQRVKEVLNLRRRIKPFMDWPAVFRDTVGLTVSDARVQARLFQRTDGENRVLAVTMLNEERVEGATIKVDLQAIGAPRSVHLFRFGGTLEEVEELGDGVQVIPVPADDISAAVIVANVGPELSVVPWMEQMMRPGEDGLALGMFLPGGPMGSLDVDITWPGTPGPLEEVAAEVPNLRRMEILDPTHLTSLARWLRVPARLSWEGGHADVWTMLAPPLVNGDFEYAEDGYLSHWATPPCLEDPGQGKQCIRLDRQTAPAHLIQSLTPVKPNCRYRFRCMVKRGEGATGWAGAHVLEYLEGNEFARSAALNGTKLGEWETLETTFTTHADPRTTAIYLYNFDDTQPAWFDGLELDEVR
ncbi:MAG: hypothetical protein FJX74_23490 [Armatimonadetes bacterium]|nr:hypothetical protein [Armatimonadota bacterium]